MRALILTVLIVVAILVAAVSWLLSDPNRFKDDLTRLIQEQTGLTVRVAGDLSWRLWPPVQLVANNVSADWTENLSAPLVSAESLALDANLLPLLSSEPKLTVNGVSISGLHARLKEVDGQANWMPPGYQGEAPPPVPVPAGEGADWVVDNVSINDSVVEYEAEGTSLRVELASLTVSGVQPNRPVPIATQARIIDRSAPEPRAATVRLSTTATMDPSALRYQLDDLRVEAKPDWMPLAIAMGGNLSVDVNADTLAFTDGTVNLGGAKATLNVEVSNLTGALTVSGAFDAPTQDLSKLAELIDADVPSPAGARANFKASAERVVLSDLEAKIPGTTLTGGVIIDLSPRLNANFDLTADQYTIESSEPGAPVAIGGGFAAAMFAAPAAVVDPLDVPILPLEDLREFDWTGSVLVKRLTMDGAVFPNTVVQTRNNAGEITGEVTLPDFFGGNARTNLAIDARKAEPVWRVVTNLKDVNSRSLMDWLDQQLNWAALFLADGEVTMKGNTQRELLTSLAGNTRFDGGKGQLDVSRIKELALALAAVAGGTGKVAQWPEMLNYKRFDGDWKVDGQHHDMRMHIDNIRLEADGTYDPLATNMDMQITFTIEDDPNLKTFLVDPMLMNVGIPVHCTGTTQAPSCKLDEAGVRRIVADLLAGKGGAEANAKIDEAIDEKVPEEYRDAARSLLDLLRQGGQQAPPQQQRQ